MLVASVIICAICGRLFSARRFCEFRGFCGNIDVLPQISQISTDVRVRRPPTESTDLTERLAENILPQISQIYTDG